MRLADGPRVTEWWVCAQCVAQWFTPDHFDRVNNCPMCGDADVRMVTGGDVKETIA